MTHIPPDSSGAIGIFDSGVGGLSVWNQIRQRLPFEDIIYLADQDHVPYGGRAAGEIRGFSSAITRFLLDRKAKMVVVACNTASASALNILRSDFPGVKFVGMEPAVKPAAGRTHTGKIGILATPGTFDSSRYARLMVQYAGDITVYEDPCFGLVECIEKGQLEGKTVTKILRKAIEPMIAAGIDNLVLGCTHYPFVQPVIRQIVGADIGIINPAPAVAQQTWRLLEQEGLGSDQKRRGSTRFFSTRISTDTTLLMGRLTGIDVVLERAFWRRESGSLLLLSENSAQL